MANLTQCKDCGHNISRNAANCPNCGASNKRTSVITWLALVFIGIPVLWTVFSASFINNDVQSAESNAVIADEVSVVTPEPITNWDYNHLKDEMRSTETVLAETISLNKIQLDSPHRGGTSLFLILRSTPDSGNDVLISTDNGQLWCEYQNCYMSVKFDDSDVKKYPLAKAAAGSSQTMFLGDNPNLFIDKLKNSSKVMIEIGFYRYGNQQFQFDSSGLEWSQ